MGKYADMLLNKPLEQEQQQPPAMGKYSNTLLPGAVQPQAPEQLGLLESFGQGVVHGGTLGFADELYGIGAGLIPGGQNREEATEAARARYARANPAAALAGELAGSLALPGGAAKTGAGLAARLARGAIAGGLVGGAGAIGRSEGTLAERAPAAIPGAALGAGFGGAGAAAAPAIARGAQRLIRGRKDQTAVQSMVDTMTRADDIGAGTEDAIMSIKNAAANTQSGIKTAYEKIAKLEGIVDDKAAFELLSQKLGRVLDDGRVAFKPEGDGVVHLVDNIMHNLKKGATPADMDEARKVFAKMGRDLKSRYPHLSEVYDGLKTAVDDWTFDVLTNKLYRGDETALKQIKGARKLVTEYHRLFKMGQGKDSLQHAAGNMIQKLVNDDVNAEEAVNLLFGVNSLGIKGSRQAMARIREFSPEAFQQLQSAHFLKLLTGTGRGDFLSGKQISGRIERLNASGLAKTLYGDRLADINQFGSRIKAMDSKGVGRHVAEFIRHRPFLANFMIGTATGHQGMTFGGLLGVALNRSSPTTLGKLKRAARPEIGTTRRAGQVGGTLGGMMGPSLAGG